ncbi:MAG: ATP-dependent metallopeptidase FtsH/Yme1/Tma family protein [Nitrospirae bacterium]|nr:ATP-dependent metallopeptidase FtsH/Yme1/Tma family protein [Nitrospirota bacterium]
MGYKNIALWLAIGLIMVLVFTHFSTVKPQEEELIFSDFLKKAEAGEVAEVLIKENYIAGKLKDNTKFRTYTADYPDLIKGLKDKDVKITVRPPDDNKWYAFLLNWGPMLILLGIWIFFMQITFADVAGVDEAKDEVVELVDFLKDPQKFQKLGGRIPKGVLVVGPPGTGKTLLARAIAGEADVPFFNISGSDFVEMFVGVGASRVRDLFEQGKKNAPCIIFIDEIDAVGRHRGAGLGGGHDEREQTLNQLLVEMDGFDTNEGVILIAATNRPDVLDPALLRPGRFDRQIIVSRPDIKGRLGILQVHTKKVTLSKDVNLEVIARGTPGFTGADLSNLVNEAALLGARRSKKEVDAKDFEDAKDKVLMGVERRSMFINEEEKKNTAFHEAGHALVAKLIPGTDPIHKVTIIPRGRALGLTQQLPIDDRYTYPSEYLHNTIAILLGGRAAEELVLKHMTTGAGNDIERATGLARKMVCEWGMSEKLGPLTFGKKDEEIFLGRDIVKHRDYSESTAIEIDNEIKTMVMKNYERARNLLKKNLKSLKGIAAALLEKETLDGNEIEAIIQNAGISPA